MKPTEKSLDLARRVIKIAVIEYEVDKKWASLTAAIEENIALVIEGEVKAERERCIRAVRSEMIDEVLDDTDKAYQSAIEHAEQAIRSWRR